MSDEWRPIKSAPRDGTWFEARCTTPGFEQTRVVHFADPHDRLPISEPGVIWWSVPDQWRPME